MSEALSQSQIDELLNRARAGASAAEADTKPKIKKYDFYSPKRFTKDQLNSLHTMYENYARTLGMMFTNLTRNVSEISVVGIEEVRYNEFNNALPENTLIGVITIDPDGPVQESLLLVQFPTNLGFYIVNRVLGGSEIGHIDERDFTEIELAILSSVYDSVKNSMVESWSSYFPLVGSMQSLETNGRMLQIYAPQDIMVLVSLELTDDIFSGIINICMPADNLEEIIEKSNVKLSRTVKQQDPEMEQAKKDIVFDYLKTSDVNIEAILERSKMDLCDLASLQKGDVVVLNKNFESNIDIEIEGIPWCTARLGEVRSNKAFKIVELINNEKNEG